MTGAIRNEAHTVFAPIQSATHAVLQPIGNFFTGAFNYGSLKRENAQLRDQLAQARAQALSAANAQRELNILSQQDHLDFVGNIPTIEAQVIDDSSSNFEVSVEINRGTNSGIAVGMPVVTGGGLIGHVDQASGNGATVLLLTDSTFSVGVRLTTTGQVFVADGDGRGKAMTLELLGDTTQIHPGDRLVTSGLSMEQYPKDIPVATVKTVQSAPGQLQPTVTVTPSADLSQLEYVAVMQWSPQTS